MNNGKTVLCTVENFAELDDNGKSVNGTLALVSSSQHFHLYWSPLDGTITQYITAVFDYEKVKENDTWNQFEPFCFNCAKFDKLIMTENPYKITLNITGKQTSRVFQISDMELISITIFIEQLLLNGIAVPSAFNRYSLEFYKGGHNGTYAFTPAHIQLKTRIFSNLEEFWNGVLSFFEKLMVHLDASGAIPTDPNFPINTAARAIHERVVEKVNEYVKKIPIYEDITVQNYNDAFDASGKLKDPANFKLRLFHSKKDQELLPKLIPFATGIYPLDSTEKERDEIKAKLTKEYNQICEQVKLIQQAQIDGNDKLFSTFRVIDHDVTRTDRGNLAFKSDKSEGLKMLSELLRMYSIYNPPISYLQGMNDLFVPFITAYMPIWSEEGIPLDKDGNKVDFEPLKPIIFWCFDAMLLNTQQIILLENVTEHCGHIAEQVQDILNKVSPLTAIWLRRHKLQGLLWCFADFVLLFKRSFEDIWSTWMQFNSCDQPDRFLLYFVTAVLISCFDKYLVLPDVTMTAMMDAFPTYLADHNPIYLGKVALWIQENYKIESDEKKQNPAEKPKFEFFNPMWD